MKEKKSKCEKSADTSTDDLDVTISWSGFQAGTFKSG